MKYQQKKVFCIQKTYKHRDTSQKSVDGNNS